MAELIKPQDFVITDDEGTERRFIISKFDAVSGREIVAKYPTSALPRIGDYAVSEETMFKLMAFVAVEPVAGGPQIRLATKVLVQNHVPDWETLAKIEMEMMKYNCSFFRNGRISSFLEGFVQSTLAKILEISTRSSAQSSPAAGQPSTSSAPSTP